MSIEDFPASGPGHFSSQAQTVQPEASGVSVSAPCCRSGAELWWSYHQRTTILDIFFGMVLGAIFEIEISATKMGGLGTPKSI